MVDLGVVDPQRPGAVSRFEAVEREMPPVVHREQVPGAPIADAVLHEANALVDPTLHLERVHDRVHRPDVVGIGRQRGETGGLRPGVQPELLETERLHAAHEAGMRVIWRQRADRASGTVTEVAGIAEEEVELVPDHQRQEVGRPLLQEVVEPAGGAGPVAIEPRRDDTGMHRLPRVGRHARQRVTGSAGVVQVGHVGAHQVEIRHEDVRHRGFRLLLDELAGEIDGEGIEAQQAIHRTVVQGDRVGGARHRVPVVVASAAIGGAGGVGDHGRSHRSLLGVSYTTEA